jgi:hypothetical protein
MDGRLATIDSVEADQGVDLEVCKMEIHINGIQADKEVYEGFFLLGRDVGKEGRCDGCAGGEWRINSDVELEGLGIYVADVYTTFVREENRVALTSRVDADVVFGVGRVRKERFDDEIIESASDGLDLND